MTYFDEIFRLISSPKVQEKLEGPFLLLKDFTELEFRRTKPGASLPRPVPGRPKGIKIVSPKETGRRHNFSTVEGRIALLHAIAQIELSAVELALDSSYAYPEAPHPYHREMLALAAEEARHFELLAARLVKLGSFFGALPIHRSLWEQAGMATSAVERMVIVPRILEARGLDATPGLIARFRAAGDEPSARILETIYQEEIGHVATGSRWFRRFALESGEDPDRLFFEILKRFQDQNGRGRLTPNIEARRQAGFSDRELSALAS